MAIGDHLFVNHGLYTHHGIDLGNGTVIHYGRGLADLKNAKIEIVSLEVFSDAKPIHVLKSDPQFTQIEIVERAKSRLGENCYDVFDNNCEHFAHWCRSNHARSPQAASTKTILRQSAAVAARPMISKALRNVVLRRTLTGPLVVADVLQAGAELAAIQTGVSQDRSEQIGVRVGAAASVGVGMLAGGPVGAASGLGIWMASQIFAKAAIRTGQQAISNRPE